MQAIEVPAIILRLEHTLGRYSIPPILSREAQSSTCGKLGNGCTGMVMVSTEGASTLIKHKTDCVFEQENQIHSD